MFASSDRVESADVYRERTWGVDTAGGLLRKNQIKTKAVNNTAQARKRNCANNRTTSGLGVCFGFKVVSGGELWSANHKGLAENINKGSPRRPAHVVARQSHPVAFIVIPSAATTWFINVLYLIRKLIDSSINPQHH